MNRLRGLVGLAGAVVIAIGLFWLMQWLLLAGERPAPAATAAATLERIRVVAPPPPPPPPPPAETTAREALTPVRPEAPLAIAVAAIPDAALSFPDVEAPIVVTGKPQTTGVLAGVAGGDALAAFARGQAGFEGAELVPVSSARPKYPRSAAERGIEGWVELIFIVTGEGRVRNVRVLDASPRGIFEDSAVNAMRNWLYAPYYVDGKPVAREATQLIRFRAEDIEQIYLWDD